MTGDLRDIFDQQRASVSLLVERRRRRLGLLHRFFTSRSDCAPRLLEPAAPDWVATRPERHGMGPTPPGRWRGSRARTRIRPRGRPPKRCRERCPLGPGLVSGSVVDDFPGHRHRAGVPRLIGNEVHGLCGSHAKSASGSTKAGRVPEMLRSFGMRYRFAAWTPSSDIRIGGQRQDSVGDRIPAAARPLRRHSSRPRSSALHCPKPRRCAADVRDTGRFLSSSRSANGIRRPAGAGDATPNVPASR